MESCVHLVQWPLPDHPVTSPNYSQKSLNSRTVGKPELKQKPVWLQMHHVVYM